MKVEEVVEAAGKVDLGIPAVWNALVISKFQRSQQRTYAEALLCCRRCSH